MKTILANSLFYTALVVVLSCTLCAASQNFENLRLGAGTFFGAAGNNGYLMQTVTDAQGNVYGTGSTTSIVTTPNAFQKDFKGVCDVMVFKMDPTLHTLLWSTYIGGSGFDLAGGIAVSPEGDVIVCGYTSSPDFPHTVEDDAKYCGKSVNSNFVLKLSADGSHIKYSRLIGFSSNISDQFMSYFARVHCTINPQGDVFIISQSNSDDVIITPNAYQPKRSGQSDLVLTKLDATGAISYSTFFGGKGVERSYDICYANNTIYCSGSTSSVDMPLNTGRIADSLSDCFILSFHDGVRPVPAHCLVYGTSAADAAYGIHYDVNMNKLLLSGVFGAAREDGFQLSRRSNKGGFLARIDTALTQLDHLTILGNGLTPTSICSSNAGSVFLCGSAAFDAVLPVTANAFQASSHGGYDVFVLALDTTLTSPKYCSYFGGTLNDYGAARIHVNNSSCSQNVVVSLTTHAPDFPTTYDAYQPFKLNKFSDQPALISLTTDAVEMNLSVVDLENVQLGQPCTLRFTSNSSLPITTSIDFDVICAAEVFDNIDGSTSTVRNSERVMHVHVPVSQVKKDSKVIAALKGQTFVSTRTSTPIRLENIRVDELLCSRITHTPGILSTRGCFQEGRNVEFTTSLRAVVLPQPVRDLAQIALSSSHRGTVSIECRDELGRRVGSWEQNLVSDKTAFELDMNHISSGLYYLTFKTEPESTIVPFIKY